MTPTKEQGFAQGHPAPKEGAAHCLFCRPLGYASVLRRKQVSALGPDSNLQLEAVGTWVSVPGRGWDASDEL